jgi:SPP1 gp7 family putative phage head morphogenesis protein
MTSRAELLAFRRRLTEAAASKRRRPKVPPPAPPSGAIVAHTKLLRELSAEMDAAILDALRAEGIVRADAADGDPPFTRAQGRSAASRAAAAVRRVLKGKSFVARLQEISSATATASREAWARQLKASLGVDLPTAEPELGPVITAFRDENVALIRSLAADKVTRVRAILDDAGAGTRVEEVAKSIREMGEVTRSRAELIARDQVLKLNAEVTQKRHEAAGIVEFVWSTSRDERVRPDHKVLEGKRYRYDDPPIVDRRRGTRGLPGVHFQCRCVAVPVIPGFDD